MRTTTTLVAAILGLLLLVGGALFFLFDPLGPAPEPGERDPAREPAAPAEPDTDRPSPFGLNSNNRSANGLLGMRGSVPDETSDVSGDTDAEPGEDGATQPDEAAMSPGGAASDSGTERGAPATVTGRVIDIAGEPIEGVSVRPIHRLRALGVAAVRTDSDGRFSVRVPAIGERVTIVAETDGAMHNVDPPILAAGTTYDVGDIQLIASVTVSGTVVDPAGRPVETGRVLLRPEGIDPDSVVLQSIDRRGSASVRIRNGTFEIRYGGIGTFVLQAIAEGFRSSEFVEGSREEAAGGATYRLTLREAATRPIIVLDAATSEPISAAEVSLIAPGRIGEPLASARTDETGRADLAMPGGAMTVEMIAEAPGYVPAEQLYRLRDASLEPITIRLTRGVLISGRVLDPDGAPTAARVQVRPVEEQREVTSFRGAGWQTTSDRATGRFELLVEPGVAELIAARSFDWRGIPSGEASSPAMHVIPAGPGVDVGDVSLRPTRFVRVRVLDANGAPAQGVAVESIAEPNSSGFGLLRPVSNQLPGSSSIGSLSISNRTGPDGIVTLDRFSTLRALLRITPRQGEPLVRWVPTVADRLADPTEIQLRPDAILRVQIFDEAGEPIIGRGIGIEQDELMLASMSSDTAGRAEMQLAVGRYVLRVGSATREVEVAAPETQIEWEVPGDDIPTAERVVIVQTSAGLPVPDVRIVLMRRHELMSGGYSHTGYTAREQGTTDSNGRVEARIGMSTHPQCFLRVYLPDGGEPIDVRLPDEPAREPLVITVPERSATLRLRVTTTADDAGARPVAGAAIRVTRRGAPGEAAVLETTTADESGMAELADLPTGPYRVEVTSAGLALEVRDIELGPGVRELAISMHAVAALLVEVALPAGSGGAPTEATVEVAIAGDPSATRVRRGPVGSPIAFENLRRDAVYRIQVTAPGYRPAEQTVAVPIDGPLRVTLIAE